MSDQHQERPTRLGAFDKASSPRMTAVEIIAGALSLMWLIGVAVAFLGLGVANPGPDAQPIDFAPERIQLSAVPTNYFVER